MRLRNGNIFKTTNCADTIDRLLRAGWQEVKEAEVVPAQEDTTDEKMTAPTVTTRKGNPLIYKGRYLTQWLQIGRVDELRTVLTHLGVPFERSAVKKELQQLLRDRIREIKERKDDEYEC